jgi:hypothetical protein
VVMANLSAFTGQFIPSFGVARAHKRCVVSRLSTKGDA